MGWQTRYFCLEKLLEDDWFFDEMENGNYHGAFSFLEELKQECKEKVSKLTVEDL